MKGLILKRSNYYYTLRRIEKSIAEELFFRIRETFHGVFFHWSLKKLTGTSCSAREESINIIVSEIPNKDISRYYQLYDEQVIPVERIFIRSIDDIV